MELSKKKIQFITHYSDLYGANRILLPLLKHLNKNRYDISVLLPRMGDMTNELEKEGITYDVLFYYASYMYTKNTIKFIAYPILVLLNLFQFPRIYTLIKKNKPDVIYSNTSAENIGIWISKLLNIPHISHIHEFMGKDYKAYFWGGKKCKKSFFELSDRIIFVSRSVAHDVIGTENLNEKHSIVYNGVNTDNIVYSRRSYNPLYINFGIVGVLDSAKGQDRAIEYFHKIHKEYPNSKLHIFGDKNGRYKKKLFRMVEYYNLSKSVIFHGYVKSTDDIYRQIDILLMFSRSEGFGLVTIESMVRGIPVIGYNNAATAEIIEHKQSGFLISNYREFSSAVKYLARAEDYNFISYNSYLRVIDIFNEKNYCKSIENIISEYY